MLIKDGFNNLFDFIKIISRTPQGETRQFKADRQPFEPVNI
jgi:hypothetical protein